MERDDQEEAGSLEMEVANPAESGPVGGIVGCFVNLLQLFGGPILKKEKEDDSWVVPYSMITGLDYVSSGANGIVFKGYFNGELVAVKKVCKEGEAGVKHLRKLNHENIVRFRGICTDPPYSCVIMEYCEYGTLFDYLHSPTNLLPSQLMNWSKGIARGMRYLHNKNIIHRDLKSPNILIADDFTVKVSDFGTSRRFGKDSTLMSFAGTVAWMAPEVIRHENCSEKMDVWSFGVVLWEMITKEIPYKGLETHTIVWGVGTDMLSLPIPSTCPGTLQVLMCQCWQRFAKNRPPFKILTAHLEMATPDIEATDAHVFAARQDAWGVEVRESMKRQFARNNKPPHSSEPEAAAVLDVEASKPREALRKITELYEQQITRANDLFMEVCTIRLQLEQRELAMAEREKQLLACRCGQRKNMKLKRQQSSTSSDGKPVVAQPPRRKKPEQQLLVNYIDKDEGLTYTVAVEKCACYNHSVRNNNLAALANKKETVVEQNGNVEMVPVHKPKPALDNVVPDVALV